MSFQKYLGVLLDDKFNYNICLNEKMRKFNTGISMSKSCKMFWQENPYEQYINLLFDNLHYSDIICDQYNNESFGQKMNYIVDVFLAVYQI